MYIARAIVNKRVRAIFQVPTSVSRKTNIVFRQDSHSRMRSSNGTVPCNIETDTSSEYLFSGFQ